MFEDKLTDRIVKYNMLKDIENSFKKDFNLTPCLGAELEFYLLNIQDDSQLVKLEQAIGQKIKKEKGCKQYEIEIPPSTNVAYYPEIIYKIQNSIQEEAKKLALISDFQPKPFQNDYGNSMHIHFNFLEDNDAEKYAEILCHYLPLTIDAFLQKKRRLS